MSTVDTNWYGDQIAAAITRQMIVNVKKCLLDLQSESAKEAPIDTGDLRGNCTANLPEGVELSGTVGYNLPYALKQHEGLFYRHTDGKAKFLEDPHNRKKALYMKMIGEVRL